MQTRKGQSIEDESMEIIEKYSKFWMEVAGTRGYTGKKARNATTMFNALFDSAEDDEEEFNPEDINDNPEEV